MTKLILIIALIVSSLAIASDDLNEYQLVILKHYLESRVEQHLITNQDAAWLFDHRKIDCYHCMKNGCDITTLLEPTRTF